jgi:hypothetical protein
MANEKAKSPSDLYPMVRMKANRVTIYQGNDSWIDIQVVGQFVSQDNPGKLCVNVTRGSQSHQSFLNYDKVWSVFYDLIETEIGGLQDPFAEEKGYKTNENIKDGKTTDKEANKRIPTGQSQRNRGTVQAKDNVNSSKRGSAGSNKTVARKFKVKR